SRGKVTGRLQPYFQRALQYANCRQYRSPWRRCDAIPWEECTLYSEDDPTSRAQQRAVNKLLCQLDPLDEQVLRLQAVHGRSGPEIAARLGISPDAARQRLTAARRRFVALFPKYSQ